jgi:hypothetical protein
VSGASFFPDMSRNREAGVAFFAVLFMQNTRQNKAGLLFRTDTS